MTASNVYLFQQVKYLGQTYLVVSKEKKRVLIKSISNGATQWIGYNRLKRKEGVKK